MSFERLENPLGEPLLAMTASSGLRVLMHHRPDFVGTFAAFGTNFGSVDRVGGADGQPVPEGLAHFLEHKLFEDQDGDVSDRFAELGASTNAMTGFVGTTYIVSAIDEAERCLDLLLDFVQTPWFTDELVEKEQGIIAQEIRMYDDDPDWRAFFGLMGCLYERHPVRDNIAGTVESIAEIDAATLQRCYDLFYHPSNMCLALSGPLDPERVLALVEADQAPRGTDAAPRHRRVDGGEPPQRRLERFDMELPISRPRWLMGIKERDTGGAGEAVLRRELATRVLLDILFGRSSAAFESLYAEGLIDETFGVSHTAEASFGFSTLGGDCDDPGALQARVMDVFERARREGLDAQAFGRVRNKLYGGLLRAVDSPENVAYSLISDCFRGSRPFASVELVEQLTLDELMRRLEEHVHDEAIATAVIRPASA